MRLSFYGQDNLYLAKTNVGNDELARQAGELINLARSGDSLSGFAARSILDSIVSCDVVTEGNTPPLSQTSRGQTVEQHAQ